MIQFKKFKKFLGEEKIEFYKNYKFSLLSTIGIGGKVSLLVIANTYDELQKIATMLQQNNIKWFVVGKGSNSIGAFKYFNGVVVKLGNDFDFIVKDNETDLIVGAKTSLINISKFCLSNGLSGLEWSVGIPGQLGGALCMNAGAYGKSIYDCVLDVKFLNEDGKIVTLSKEDLTSSYRKTIFTNTKNVILSSTIRLEIKDKEEIAENINAVNQKRIVSLILGKNVGSTFKNPENAIAGKLIEQAGFKGYCYKGLKVSSVHANIIINTKKASFKNYLKLIENIQAQVFNKFNYKLELEPIVFKD